MDRAHGTGRDQLVQTVLPPALEVMTAWSLAEDEGDTGGFTDAMERVLGDAARAEDPNAALAHVLFGMTSLSGILLDQLATLYGVPRGEVLHAVHQRYLAEPT